MGGLAMTTLLIDADNILARADFATRKGHAEMSSHGINTAALLVFINVISKHVKAIKPDRMLVCWDQGHGFRDAIYPGYKANRVKVSNHDSPPVVDHADGTRTIIPVDAYDDEPKTPRKQSLEFCTWASVPHFSRKDWEADDLLAIYAASTPGEKVILSGDKDLLQLVHTDTIQIRPGNGGDEVWDVDRVVKEKGCTPEQIPLLMALTGDSVDGVPGVRGLGPKKALKILDEAAWDWDSLLGLLGSEKAQEAITSRRLVDLRNPAFAAYADDISFLLTPRPAPNFTPSAPGSVLWEPLLAFLEKFEMASVLQRLKDGTLWDADPAEPNSGSAQQAFAGFDQ